MFTGIVEEMGKVDRIYIGGHSGKLRIKADKVLKGTIIGDSIAVNGVCLTVTDMDDNSFEADVMAETFKRSSLSMLKSGSYVNLERAMTPSGRMGGHIVSGHIDTTADIIEIRTDENAIWYTLKIEPEYLKYIVEKGSVAIDGTSLTVAYVDNKSFKVSIIPHTQSETIMQYKKAGDIVNIECDIIGKYVESLLKFDNNSTKNKGITMDFLIENGF